VASAVLEYLSEHERSLIDESQITAEVARRLEHDSLLIRSGVASTVALLRSLGLVEFNNGKRQVTGQVRQYALRSLLWYVRHAVPVLSNWDRASAGRHVAANDILDNAPYFLSLMENQRIVASKDIGVEPEPVRAQRVAAVIIKGGEGRAARYLHQWDGRSRQFQLIGGKVREGESPLHAANREMNEELSEASLVAGVDYELSCLPDQPVEYVSVSRTYGALTRYECYFFSSRFKIGSLSLSQSDRWLTVQEMGDGQTYDGRRVRDARAFRLLETKVNGGVSSLPQSINLEHRLPWTSYFEIKPGFWGMRVDVKALLARLFS
jgi:8-oxo-dGTP pyrophosphatase MutT (NUDIX family)